MLTMVLTALLAISHVARPLVRRWELLSGLASKRKSKPAMPALLWKKRCIKAWPRRSLPSPFSLLSPVPLPPLLPPGLEGVPAGLLHGIASWGGKPACVRLPLGSSFTSWVAPLGLPHGVENQRVFGISRRRPSPAPGPTRLQQNGTSQVPSRQCPRAPTSHSRGPGVAAGV